ncbi:MAG: small subunit ribosomal protein [Patescibacteria group bacterium]|jgi:small subunit ribosomal protein S2|nr:small subunit ribosomal protein [Patescibacteria group bacterium]
MSKQNLQEMIDAGVHFGYTKTRRHPSAKPFIFDTKNKVDLIDINKTEEMLKKASEFMASLGKDGKKVLFVGTKAEAKDLVKNSADKLRMPFVISRWIGGTLTNFGEIKRRVDVLTDLKERKDKGLLEKYTKKEQSDFGRQINKMEGYFGGLVGMERKPDAIVIIDVKKEINAFREAKQLKIPVISISSTDCDISEVDYPILANDAAISSLKLLLDKLTESYSA